MGRPFLLPCKYLFWTASIYIRNEWATNSASQRHITKSIHRTHKKKKIDSFLLSPHSSISWSTLLEISRLYFVLRHQLKWCFKVYLFFFKKNIHDFFVLIIRIMEEAKATNSKLFNWYYIVCPCVLTMSRLIKFQCRFTEMEALVKKGSKSLYLAFWNRIENVSIDTQKD
jgi:hypothetical protein